VTFAALSNAAEFFAFDHLPGEESKVVRGISADGSVIVGYSSGIGDTEAWRWTAATGMVPLAEELVDTTTKNRVLGVSADGSTVFGTRETTSGTELFHWTEEGGIGGFVSLELPPDSLSSTQTDVSEDGSAVVGSLKIPTSEPVYSIQGYQYSREVPCLWTAGGDVVSLGVREGFDHSRATRVSYDGSIIAGRSDSWFPDGVTKLTGAWLWSEDTGYVDLGQALITDMSADGSVVVGFTTPSPYQQFRWTKETGMEILPFDSDLVLTVSPDGSVIFGGTEGEVWGTATPFVRYADNSIRDLRELFTTEYGLGDELQGWDLGWVGAISADGRTIVGQGTNPDGDHEPWTAILDPYPVPGDADQDFDFDQLDLVQVQVAGKYLTGEPATWGEGDWNGAPVVFSTDPPQGDDVFNQLDIVAAQQTGLYLQGSYASVQSDGFVVVPEPSGIALMTLGLVGVFACLRRGLPRRAGLPTVADIAAGDRKESATDDRTPHT
jgi:uncharacterized membrane protein